MWHCFFFLFHISWEAALALGTAPSRLSTNLIPTTPPATSATAKPKPSPSKPKPRPAPVPTAAAKGARFVCSVSLSTNESRATGKTFVTFGVLHDKTFSTCSEDGEKGEGGCSPGESQTSLPGWSRKFFLLPICRSKKINGGETGV